MDALNQTTTQRATVLQIVPALHTGGAERTAVDIACALDAAGWGSIIASEGGALVDQLPASTLHQTLPLDTKNPLTIYRNATRIARLIDATGADIVHARSRAPAWSAMWAARRMKVPFVTTYHGAYSEGSRIKALYNSIMARADAVIANSQWTANLVAARYPWARDRIVAIPRGTDFALFDPATISDADRTAQRAEWGVEADDFVVLHLARMGSWKGQDVVVDAIAQLGTDRPRVVAVLAGALAGKGDFDAKLERRIKTAGLGDRIVMPGHCMNPALALATCDCAVVASTRPEAFGRAAVEAGAMERPVIATDLGAVGETIVAEGEDKTGWLVPPGDATALADAIRAVVALPEVERHTIGTRARRRNGQLFSISAMQRATLAVYDKLLESKDSQTDGSVV